MSKKNIIVSVIVVIAILITSGIGFSTWRMFRDNEKGPSSLVSYEVSNLEDVSIECSSPLKISRIYFEDNTYGYSNKYGVLEYTLVLPNNTTAYDIRGKLTLVNHDGEALRKYLDSSKCSNLTIVNSTDNDDYIEFTISISSGSSSVTYNSTSHKYEYKFAFVFNNNIIKHNSSGLIEKDDVFQVVIYNNEG